MIQDEESSSRIVHNNSGRRSRRRRPRPTMSSSTNLHGNDSGDDDEGSTSTSEGEEQPKLLTVQLSQNQESRQHEQEDGEQEQTLPNTTYNINHHDNNGHRPSLSTSLATLPPPQTPPRRAMSLTTRSSTSSEIRDWSYLQNSDVAVLDFSNHQVKADHLHGLQQTLMEYCVHGNLHTLDLSNNHLGTKGMEKLQRLLSSHPTLRTIRLARNGLKGRRAIRHLVKAVTDNAVIRTLDLSHNQLSDTQIASYVATLLDSREVACRLSELDVSNNGTHLTDKAAWALGGALVQGHNTTLLTLKLSGNALGPAGGDALGTLLKLSHSLQALHVANCNLGDQGVVYICQGLLWAENEPALRVLDVAWNVLHDTAAEAVAQVLQHNGTLHTVQLECNGIGDRGASALAAALPHAESLQRLDVRGNQIHDGGAIALAVALVDPRCHALQLDWEMNAHMTAHIGQHRLQGAMQLRMSRKQWLDTLLENLKGLRRFPPLNYTTGDDEVVEICKFVAVQQKQHPITLPVVRFKGPGITLRGCKAIMNQLLCSSSVTLTHLYLVHTSMGNDGADLLAQALLRNKTLTTLTCVDCQWTEQGAVHLSRALPRHTQLSRLDLRHNRIGTPGALALLHAITEETPRLHTLYLGRNHIGDLAVRSLTSIGHLLTLHLADNLLTDAAALDLARVCGNIGVTASSGMVHEIKWLDLSQNYISQRGKQALDLFLPPVCTLEASGQHSGLPPTSA